MNNNTPNLDQWFSTLRILGASLAAVLSALGLISHSDLQAFQDALNSLFGSLQQAAPLVTASITAAFAIWGFIRNSRKSKIAAAAADPDVAKVLVKAGAIGPVADLAADHSVPKVGKVGLGQL